MSFFKDSTMLNYDINLNYYHLDDLFGTDEDNVVLDTYWDRYFGNEYITLDGTIDFNTYTAGARAVPRPARWTGAKQLPQLHRNEPVFDVRADTH